MKILHLIDCRDDPGSVRRLRLLAPALAAEDAVEICCLGSGAGWTDSLRQAGIAIHAARLDALVRPGRPVEFASSAAILSRGRDSRLASVGVASAGDRCAGVIAARRIHGAAFAYAASL